MKFETYFVLNQDILVRRFATAKDSSRIESCRASLTARNGSVFELTLHSDEEDLPFSVGDFLELNTARFELGVRLTGLCLESAGRKILFEASEDLELFYRRKYWRNTFSVWYGLVRSEQSKQPLYDVWEKALILRDENNLDPSIHVKIVRSPLNLSAGGVRMELPLPVKLNESCLLYLCLDDGKPTVCALCEIVWVETGESASTRLCGLRFSNLLESDLKRIDRYVTQHSNFDPSGNGTPFEQSHTV